MKTLITIITLMTLISFSCCTPDEDPLAACKADPTCEYFECLVDGEKWVASCESGPIFGCKAIDAQYYKDIPSFEMSIDNNQENQLISLNTIKALKLGNNDFYLDTFIQTKFAVLNTLEACRRFIIDTNEISMFQISILDTSKFIIEAKFNFITKNNCNEIKVISNGEFRTKYRF